jgi:hypothetical protein
MIKSLIILISVLAIPFAHASGPQGHVKGDVKYSVLAIRYVGESDKPVPTIVISDSEAGAEWYRSAVLKRSKLFTYGHVVNAALLEKLIAEAESFERIVRPELEKIPESGGNVSVTVITPGKKQSFLYYTEMAVSQVNALLKHCEGEGLLRANLLKFQKQIRPL